ncbi:MAG: tetratricopeptide repeat protein [Cytophagaceae bacterium]|nr:tetratricopeptide repeat protein [Cytophagaceae bacterium]
MAKKNSGLEFLESSEGLVNELGKAQNFFEKYRTLILGALVGLVAIAAGIVGWKFYQNSQNEEGQTALFPAVYEFENDSLRKALKGDGASLGLTDIADEYGASKAGNLANFYAGAALLKQGKYDEAIAYLEKFSSSDLLVQARAYALLGDARMEKKQYDEATGAYKKAAEYKPNKFFTPGYLMKLAVAHEAANQPKEALAAYDEIVEKYPESAEYASAKKYQAKLQGAVSE